ncbi:hypothetical protein KXR53_32100 [Inquilinus limosus]|uniref:hypothetical protein n=1 Tax=Inquilinus limosus TaxID=171674 RepID=UPI003F15E00E
MALDAADVKVLSDTSKLTVPEGTDPTYVSVMGYASQGDGGGGFFVWDAHSTAPADDGMVFNPSSDPDAEGRWLRLLDSNVIQAQQFGAVGNGAPTSDDGPALASMLDYAAARIDAGNPVEVSIIGKFRTTRSLTFKRPFMSVRFDATIIAAAETSSFTNVPDWNGAASSVDGTPVKCVLDNRRGGQSNFNGTVLVQSETATSGAGLAAYGASWGILTTPDGTTVPNIPGMGGSNSSWDAIHTQGLDYAIYTPDQGTIWNKGQTYAPGTVVSHNRRVYVSSGAAAAAADAPRYVMNRASYLEYLLNYEVDPTPDNQFLPDGQLKDSNSKDPVVVRHSAGRFVLDGWFVVHDGRTYRVTLDAGMSSYQLNPTPPTHVGNIRVGANDHIGWQYLRTTAYCAAGVGMTVRKLFARSSKNAIRSQLTATDDCFLASVRVQESKAEALWIAGGFLNIGSLFASAGPQVAAYAAQDADGNVVNQGSPWGQNFGELLIGNAYIAGEWERGLILGQASTTRMTIEPDSDYKAASGALVELHPAATSVTADILFRDEVVEIARNSDYLLVDGSVALAENTILTWQGGFARILSVLKPATGPQFVVVRPGPGMVVPPDGGVALKVGDDEVGQTVAKTYRTLLAAGLVGVCDINLAQRPAILARQIRVRSPHRIAAAMPFRLVRSITLPNILSQDLFIAETPDTSQGTLYRLSNSALVAMSRDGIYDRGATGRKVPILLENGRHQSFSLITNGQLMLPSASSTDPDSLTTYSPPGAELYLRITNPAAGVGGQPFFAQATTGHPPVTWRGGTPPAWGTGPVDLYLWTPDGTVWFGIVLGSAPDVRSGTVDPGTAGIIPRWIGDEYLNTTTKAWWKAAGTASADWRALS